MALDSTSERLSGFGRRMEFLMIKKEKKSQCEWLCSATGLQKIRESPPMGTFKTQLENALRNLI